LEGVEGISFIYFDKNDVVRHRLVKEIIDAYERHSKESEGEYAEFPKRA
ncbi:MAG TPA: PhoH family protein, partial [Rhodothermales bacterium]|nr:PhoH family protein [Rhodothermales bacterium]